MVDETILAAFIRNNFRTVCSLELLLLLHATPGRSWTSADLVRELRASTTLINQALAQFFERGLILEKSGTWQLAALDAGQQEILRELALLYRQRPIATISLFREADPIQGLADAFKVRRDDNE
jgi:hypothetical protein